MGGNAPLDISMSTAGYMYGFMVSLVLVLALLVIYLGAPAGTKMCLSTTVTGYLIIAGAITIISLNILSNHGHPRLATAAVFVVLVFPILLSLICDDAGTMRKLRAASRSMY